MKKGFTLVELMAIIILLGLISIIVVPTINDTLKNSKQKSYEAQVALIIEAANKWGIKNAEKLPLNDEKVYVKVSDLIKEHYIENINSESIKNPIDNSDMDGCVVIKYLPQYNQYNYEYSNDCQ